MFPESSTWRADVARVTADGRRVPIELPWSGYRWDELVRDRGLRYPAVRRHADAGLDNQLAFLECRARLGGPQHPAGRRDALPGGQGHRLAQRRPAAHQGAPEPSPGGRGVSAAGLVGRLDDLLGRPVSMRALALRAGVRRADRAPASAARSWPTGSTDAPTAMPSTSPTCAWYPELPAAVYLGLLVARGGGGASPCRSACSRAWRRRPRSPIVAYNLFLSTHALPQQPRLPADRARGAGGHAVRPGAVGRLAGCAAAGRRPRARPHDRAGLAAVAAALRAACVYGASGARSSSTPTGSAAPSPGSGSTRSPRSTVDGRAGLGDRRADRPELPHRCGEGDRAHRAVHGARPLGRGTRYAAVWSRWPSTSRSS